MSKGDNRRPSSIPKKEYDENFEAIFGTKKLNLWEDKDDDYGEEADNGGDRSGSGQASGVPTESTERSCSEATPASEEEKILAITSLDEHYNCPNCDRRITSYDTGGGEGFYWAECDATPGCRIKWILYSDDGSRRGLKTWEEIKSERDIRERKEEVPK